MKVLLLRHGETAGNMEKRYVGSRTDEGLTDRERKRLSEAAEKGILFKERIRAVFVSPMKRCEETAKILFPAEQLGEAERVVVPGLSECDFGRFEYKNYMDLNGDPDYQRFIDSGGTDGFPGGEEIACFRARCREAFGEVIKERLYESPQEDGLFVFVIHGGAIMAVMEAYAVPQKDYFSWQVKNGCGYLCDVLPDPGGPFGFQLGDVEPFSLGGLRSKESGPSAEGEL